MERYVCVHGHFYQPPRENPWLEAIEVQDSAYPYHNWNERIMAECYAANAASRILDGEGRITQIVSNYANISFNFGPTLLAWMEEKAPEGYRLILEADRQSRENFSGHGSAIAQAYNHMIMPLANRRDKYTQARWGIRDFEHRFGRRPEGMWLPETAVDTETLDILAELGIKFTILAPSQARRVRAGGARSWRDASGGRVDPSTAYVLRLKRLRSINLFFYDGPIARAVAFERLLDSGETFANRLIGAFSGQRAWPQLSHIATDGETYGHHHRHGEMALSYALYHIRHNHLARLTNYSEFLENHPPQHEAQIFENTSWSCMHGIERWKSDCGCNSGGHGEWNQKWRAPLRDALDWLRDALAPLFEAKAREFVKDPWAARNDYIDVILDRSPENAGRFLAKHAVRDLNDGEKVTVLKLFEIQRHAMLMYTSCGWFFDEISGIETVQVIAYAGRAVQLAQEVFGDHLEAQFLERLEQAKSNLPEHGDGRRIFEKWVKPAMLDLTRVAAHYAVSSLFEPYSESARIYCYTVQREDYQSLEAGRVRLAAGRAGITSELTHESARLNFTALDFGDHNISGGSGEFQGDRQYGALVADLREAFEKADIPDVIRAIDRHFGSSTYSLRSLFRDEQRRIVGQVLKDTLAGGEAAFSQIYEQHAPLMRFLASLGMPMPKMLATAAEFAINSALRRELAREDLDYQAIRGLLEAASGGNVPLDSTTLEFTLRKNIERMARHFAQDPESGEGLERLGAAAGLARSLPFEVNLWVVQNQAYAVLKQFLPGQFTQAGQGGEAAASWIRQFTALCERLMVRVEQERTAA